MSSTRVAVVTGSNKGIGYAIVKGLCEKFNGVVYLTARNVERGQEAVKKLNALGFKPEFHQLDINDVASIDKFRDHIKEKYGGLDVLVNNAAIAFKVSDTTPFAVQAEVTVDVNYFGLQRACKSLFPILRPHARVVNVSSSAGHLFRIPGAELRQQFADRNLTEEKLSALMQKFVADTTPFGVQAEVTVDVNYFGLIRVCKSLFPILRPHARVVNVTSAVGHLSRIKGLPLRQQFADRNLTEAKLSELMLQFVSDAKEGKHFERGWGNSAYVVSKVGASALSFIQQREMQTPGVVVNAVHPGYVDTDMTSHKGVLTIEQGAEAPLFLALQPVDDNEIRGKYVWNNKVVIDWYKEL